MLFVRLAIVVVDNMINGAIELITQHARSNIITRAKEVRHKIPLIFVISVVIFNFVNNIFATVLLDCEVAL